MKKINITIISILFITLTSCKNEVKVPEKQSLETETNQENHDDNTISVTKAQFESSKMQLGSPSEENFPEIVKVTGMIDAPPQSREVISSFYDGFVKKSNLLIGDKVRKGQALVTIENPDFIDMQQEYLEIKQEINYLKSEYERQKTLFNEQIVSQKSFQKAESEFKRKKAKLNGLRKKMQLLNININNVEQGNLTSVITLYSTINGSVSEVNVSKGTHIAKADKIMEIINIDHIHIELTAFEKDAMKIKKGQEIRFRIPEVSNESYDAEVHLVGKSIDENTRTVKVHGHLHHGSKKNRFDIGMFVDADIEIENKKALAVPTDAVVESGKSQIVLKLLKEENDKYIFEPIDVEIGENYANFTQINSDKIIPTDKILIKGTFDLLDGEGGGGHSH